MILTIDNINKSYGKTKALIEFSAELSPGIYGLLGPNGSGKSTLMNIITDNLQADSGNILFNSESVIKLGSKFREKLGFMPQFPGLYSSFTISQFMHYMASLKDIDRSTAKIQIENILTAVELSDVQKKRIGSLSGGMKQRLGLAQAILGNPEVLILDEPTAGLDPKQRIAVRNYIAQFALNRIIIIATHVVQDIEYIAKNIIILRKGVIIENAAPAELIQKIEGSVWSVESDENKVDAIKQKYKVTNISKSENGVTLRILSVEKPFETAVSIQPTIEDVYLSYVY
ncbi:MAG: hypothetical protein A2Y17_04175 [Clostridiales bacterium GWF2_38_85]|nr:MAG: hypothetical protein A2Y17_04175 [Clostridiales bacterium GWF2_38_85]HBL83451.1 ABC transporter ATP-binding protein [Clostridiales bacterium]